MTAQGDPRRKNYAKRTDLASADELASMVQAWKDWSVEPGGYLARFWCEAVGWVKGSD